MRTADARNERIVKATTRNIQYPISYLLLVLILLLASFLRFYRLDAQSLWNDEGTSVAVAGRDLATIARDAAGDIHPPLYYWLLHGWLRLTGDSEFAVRAFSALLGVLLVALTYALGRLLTGRWAGLAAAFLAAINPFQVYYSQEARMYMLLAALTAGVMWALTRVGGRIGGGIGGRGGGRGGGRIGGGVGGRIGGGVGGGVGGRIGGGVGGGIGGGIGGGVGGGIGGGIGVRDASYGLVVLLEAAGLYTHYSFSFILLALNLIFGLWLWWRRTWKPALPWAASQAAVLLLFLPWLPTAYHQLTTWPRVGQLPDLIAAVTAIAQLLLAGPAAPPLTENIAFLLLLVVIFIPSRTTGRLPKPVADLAPIVWLLVPVVLILGLGLFKEAYLKFLLVVSPAFCLLAGRFLAAPLRGEHIFRYGTAFVCVFLALYFLYTSAFGLRSYYHDPTYARDDYRGIVAYVEAVGRPGDVVLLNAPGQQEVFGYYYHGSLPVHPLPESRPLDPTATEAALEALARPGGRVFAVLWATDESDPGRFIEGWLDEHACKALDAWYGHVRLAVYAVPRQTPTTPDRVLDLRLRSPENGDEITLLGYSLLSDQLAAGDIAPITLFWQAGQTPTRRYKVFLHLLDTGNNIVGQRDTEPGGGARLTTLWPPGEVVADHYGVPIHPATPPGRYRVEVGMYDLETGRRLVTPEGASQVWLEPLAVARPSTPAPVAALGMQHSANAGLGELTLLGYDAFKLGWAHRPEVALRPGDVLHLALYWRAEVQPGGDWQVAVDLVGPDGQQLAGFVAEPVGGYPTSRWQAGDVWRGQFNLSLPGDMAPGKYRLRVRPIVPDGSSPGAFLSEPVTVNP